MSSFFLKLSGGEAGPYSDGQVAQMFAEGRVNQHTPCKTDRMAEWRTVDEFLPTLKYGSESPFPAQATARASSMAPMSPTGVTITDVNVPFVSVLKLGFKIMVAGLILAVCLAPVLLLLWFLVFAGILSFFAHLPR